MADQWKARATEAEKKLAELTKPGSRMAEEEKKQYLDQIQTLQKRRDELENEIKFVDYSKSEEFHQKYNQPYEAAWKRAATELAEIPVVDDSGAERPATANDLLRLVNMPLGQARQAATEAFGDFADDVMAHRKEIRALFDSQQEALNEARKNGMERDKLTSEQRKKQESEMEEFLSTEFQSAVQEVMGNEQLSRFFRAPEGDKDAADILEKGYAQFDEIVRANVKDPNLTPEQRASLIRKHVAQRNKASSWGYLRHLLTKAESENSELKKELEQFRGSEPATEGGTTAPASGASHLSARERMHHELRSRASAG